MKKYFLNVDFIIFDLDNTLYDESIYLFGAYNSISIYIKSKYSINQNLTYRYLIEYFIKNGRKDIFNSFLDYFNLPHFELSILLKILREYTPTSKISLFPIMLDILIYLKDINKEYVIITNGNISQQKNKIKNIDWKNDILCHVYYANSIKPKPNPQIFYDIIMPEYNLEGKEKKILFIGDSDIDAKFSKNIGCSFLNVNEFLNTKSNYFK